MHADPLAWFKHLLPPPRHDAGVAAFNCPSDTFSCHPPIRMVKVLLPQDLLITGNGPVYLGARGGLANLSSITYTKSHFFSSLVTNGECLYFALSRRGGRYCLTLSRASCSCLKNLSAGATSCVKHNPGTRIAIPYRTLATEVAVSDRVALRRPNIIHGRDHVHDFVANTPQCRAFFKER